MRGLLYQGINCRQVRRMFPTQKPSTPMVLLDHLAAICNCLLRMCSRKWPEICRKWWLYYPLDLWKWKHQNRSIFNKTMVNGIRMPCYDQMKAYFPCRACSMSSYTEGNGVLNFLPACSWLVMCLLLFYACKDVNRDTLQIAHALHGQICPNS